MGNLFLRPPEDTTVQGEAVKVQLGRLASWNKASRRFALNLNSGFFECLPKNTQGIIDLLFADHQRRDPADDIVVGAAGQE